MLGTILWTALNAHTQEHLWRTLGRIGVKDPREGKAWVPEELWMGVEKLFSPEPSTLESEAERAALLHLVREAMDPLREEFQVRTRSNERILTDILSELIILQSLIRELPVAA